MFEFKAVYFEHMTSEHTTHNIYTEDFAQQYKVCSEAI